MKIIQLEENIFQIDSFLSEAQCGDLVNYAESVGFKEADVDLKSSRQVLSSVRNNERVNLHSDDMAKEYWDKLSQYPLPVLDGKTAIGLSPHFRFYKYSPGQKFNMHKDGRQHVGEHQTLFTILIYLNEDCIGGETKFRQNDVTVSPKIGSALIFEHHLWHQGVEVKSGIKYLLRSDIVYS